MRVPKLAGGPGRENQSTGSGGAPKFLKNWLAFACSPYDPDHISAPERVGDGPPRDSTHWLCLPRYSFKRMGTIIFLQENMNQSQQIKRRIRKVIKKKMYIKVYLYIMRVPKLAGGPGRENQSTGSGGAPKF